MLNLRVRQPKTALASEASKMEIFFQLSNDLFCIARQDGYFQHVSGAWEKVLGFSPTELLNCPWMELVHPEHIEASLKVMRSRSDDIIQFENRYRHKHGGYRWLSWNLSHSEDGYTYAVARDITEQKALERELGLLRSLTAAVSEAPDWLKALEVTLEQICQTTGWEYGEVWIPSPDKRELKCSPVWYNCLERLRSFRTISEGFAFPYGVGLPGRVWASKQPEWNWDVSMQSLEQFLRAETARESGIKAGFGVPILSGDRVLAILVFFTVEPRVRDSHLIELVFAIAKQLGCLMERKQTEEALRVSNQTLQTLIQTAPLAINTLDVNGNVTLWNPASERLLGWSESEVLGSFLPTIGINQQEEFWTMFQAQLQGDIRVGLEVKRQKKDGSFIDISLWTAPLQDTDGRIIGCLGIYADISQRKQTEAALQESQAQLQAILDNSPAVIYAKDLQGKYIFINQQFEMVFALNKEGVKGKTDRDIFPKEIADVFQESDRKVIATKAHIECEEIVPQGDKLNIYSSSKFPLYNSAGVPYGICGVSTNISDRLRSQAVEKQLIASLQESEERLRAVLENMPVMLDALDDRGNIIVWNRECERTTGYIATEIIGNPKIWELLYPDESYRNAMIVKWQNIGGNYRNWEWEITCKDGTVKTIAWSNISAKLPIPGWNSWGIGVDVTERKQAKAELQKANEQLESKVTERTAELWRAHQRAERELIDRRRAEQELLKQAQLIDLASDAIMIYDLNHSVTYWNQGAERQYGWTKEEVLGKNVHTHLQTLFPQSLESVCEELLRQGYWEGELIDTKRSGEPIAVFSRWTLWHDEHGKPSAILEINNNITERKEAEEKIQKLNEDLQQRNVELKAANKELEAFCYSVSHDLRSPLRSINGFSQALQEDYSGALDTLGRDYLRRICAATERMGQLIDDLLSLSRITRSQIEIATVNLSAIALSIATELLSSQSERKVEFNIAPAIQVQADARLLRVVLENLLGNAWKYTSKHLSARIEFGVLVPEAEFASAVPVYFVRDDGAGFDMTYVEKLCTPFQRLHGMTEFEGNGIGLATVQRILHRHGGNIWAESEVEKGATFYFTLTSDR